jgi:hypothetical protein
MPSDQIVTARDVLKSLAEFRRLGAARLLEDLEAREADLCEFVLEELSAIHRRLLETGATARQVRRVTRQVEALALVIIASLRRAHARLWDVDDPADGANADPAPGRLAAIVDAGGNAGSPSPAPPADGVTTDHPTDQTDPTDPGPRGAADPRKEQPDHEEERDHEDGAD